MQAYVLECVTRVLQSLGHLYHLDRHQDLRLRVEVDLHPIRLDLLDQQVLRVFAHFSVLAFGVGLSRVEVVLGRGVIVHAPVLRRRLHE